MKYKSLINLIYVWLHIESKVKFREMVIFTFPPLSFGDQNPKKSLCFHINFFEKIPIKKG
jgi:hypothetical protein